MNKKIRLDTQLIEKGFAKSRENAKALIMSGIVYVDNQKETKAGTSVKDTAIIEVRGETLKYVSRGGLKLEKAIEVFGIDLEGQVCMDGGASTGGFTDCMLQNGATKVYSVDVGYGQLDWKLRNDNRVICMEKTNIRYITEEMFPDKATFVSIDVSFISLTKVLQPIVNVLDTPFSIVCLIKPQFEAGRDKVKKGGVVKDKNVHMDVVNNIINYVNSINLYPINLTFSPVKGPNGNIEYLLYIKSEENVCDFNTSDVVLKAHETLSDTM